MHELDMEFFFFPIFRRGRIVILAIFMDVHVIYLSSFLDLSLIKHGFFFFYVLSFLLRVFERNFWVIWFMFLKTVFFFSKIRIVRKTMRTQFFIVKNNPKNI